MRPALNYPARLSSDSPKRQDDILFRRFNPVFSVCEGIQVIQREAGFFREVSGQQGFPRATDSDNDNPLKQFQMYLFEPASKYFFITSGQRVRTMPPSTRRLVPVM
jgi:hypothetical protein